MVLVRKYDGTYRMCIYFRNSTNLRRRMPQTDDLLEALGGVQLLSRLDLASGYWQMQVKEDDRPKTAFSTHRGE